MTKEEKRSQNKMKYNRTNERKGMEWNGKEGKRKRKERKGEQ
jgi:hypothetical protein